MVPIICQQVAHNDSLKYKAPEYNALCFFQI